jgi:hypothetical protein
VRDKWEKPVKKNYIYDDEVIDDQYLPEQYLLGYEDGRLDAGGGLPTLLGGIFLGAASVAIAWLMTIAWSHV